MNFFLSQRVFFFSLLIVFFTSKATGSTGVADASIEYFSFDYKKYFFYGGLSEREFDLDIKHINREIKVFNRGVNDLNIIESNQIW